MKTVNLIKTVVLTAVITFIIMCIFALAIYGLQDLAKALN